MAKVFYPLLVMLLLIAAIKPVESNWFGDLWDRVTDSFKWSFGELEKIKDNGAMMLALAQRRIENDYEDQKEVFNLITKIQKDILLGEFGHRGDEIQQELIKMIQDKETREIDYFNYARELYGKRMNNGSRRLGTGGRHRFGSSSVGERKYQVFALEQSEDGTLSARAVNNDVADAIVAKFAGENVHEGDEFRPRWDRNGEIVDSY